jgi:hypothetical protein
VSAIQEGKCAYAVGSSPDANPYRKAKQSMAEYDDTLYWNLMDFECQWDSGYAMARLKVTA